MTIFSVVTGWMQSVLGGAPAKLEGSAQDVQHNITVGGGGTYANKRVTADNTMSLSTAWAAVPDRLRTLPSPQDQMRRHHAILRRLRQVWSRLHLPRSLARCPRTKVEK